MRWCYVTAPSVCAFLGLIHVGCFFLPSTTTIASLESLDRATVLDNVTNSFRICGKYARMNNLAYFALWGNWCYYSSNVTDFIQSGPSDSCGGGCGVGSSCIEVYQIMEQDNFELSVRAFESCGPEYCMLGELPGDGELLCSGSIQSELHLAYTVQLLVTLVFLWTLIDFL